MPVEIQEARSLPKAVGFLELGGAVRAGEAGASADLKWRPSQKALRDIRMEGLPSAESHPQLSGLGEALASPGPSCRLLGARPQPGFPSMRPGLHPETPGQASKLGVVAEGPSRSLLPRQGQWDPRGGWMFVQMTCLWPDLSLLMFLASPR